MISKHICYTEILLDDYKRFFFAENFSLRKILLVVEYESLILKTVCVNLLIAFEFNSSVFGFSEAESDNNEC